MPSEVLRGLGYWFFYGIDRVGHWTDGSVPYTQNLGLLVVSFAIPVLALLAAMCVRWRHRAYFVVLTVVGVVVAVGANPYDDPSPLGGLFKSLRGVVELRARVAQHEPGGAAGGARPGGAARGRSERARSRLDGRGRRCAASTADGRTGRARDRAGDGEPARALDRQLLHR